MRGRTQEGARRAPAGALAYRRSTTALTVRALAPWAQLQARLPGTWQDVRSGTVAPTGEQRPRALTRALPAPACPSPGNAPPGPVIVPVSMMPEAARVRSVSLRARAPHSLRFREYPRPKASFTERDSMSTVPETGTKVNGEISVMATATLHRRGHRLEKFELQLYPVSSFDESFNRLINLAA
jgi:hypothetical protein